MSLRDRLRGSGGSADRRLVLVVGIGRSGTSVFTSALSQFGFAVPQPEVQADPTNPRGFGEPQWVVDFHSGLLSRLRISNFDGRPDAWEQTAALADDAGLVGDLRRWIGGELEAAPRVVVKDPRTAWMLPLWLRAADDLDIAVDFVTLLRHPAQVVASAKRWYGEARHEASRIAGWANVMLHTERETRGKRRAFVGYDAFMRDWRTELARVDTALALGLDLRATQSVAAVDGLVDPSLHRERVGWDEVDVPASLRVVADGCWAGLTSLATPDPTAPAALDALWDDYAQLYRDSELIAQWSIVAARAGRGTGKPGKTGKGGKAGKGTRG